MNLIHKGLTLLVVGSMLTSQAMAPTCRPASNQPTLTVGIDLDAGLVPYSSLTGPNNTTPTPKGADYDVVCQLRQRLGAVNLQLVKIPYNQLPTALANGTVQLAIGLSAQSQATAPAPTVAFVVYNSDVFGLIMTQATLNALQAHNPGVTITSANVVAVIAGSPGAPLGVVGAHPTGTPPDRREATVLMNSGVTAILSYSNLDDAITALNAADVVGILVNNATVNTAVAEAPPAAPLLAFNNVTTISSPQTDSAGLAIGIAPTCCQLYANVAAAVAGMVSDGTLAAINKKWNTDGTPSPLPVLTPMGCTSVAELPVRDSIAQLIFNEFCACPGATTVTSPV